MKTRGLRQNRFNRRRSDVQESTETSRLSVCSTGGAVALTDVLTALPSMSGIETGMCHCVPVVAIGLSEKRNAHAEDRVDKTGPSEIGSGWRSPSQRPEEVSGAAPPSTLSAPGVGCPPMPIRCHSPLHVAPHGRQVLSDARRRSAGTHLADWPARATRHSRG